MPKEVLKCRCSSDYKCSAPLHGEIEIITCERNCGLGCAEPIKSLKKNAKYR